ncbi:pilus assembly protein [Yersinia aleksiciae]|uniref:pilus assembly protein n=1 Tax=Yersinia aleksiciae TaxID=263819 RepID=UPI0011A656DB|nr:pilus assembly protein [Yersinia aleksiciae]
MKKYNSRKNKLFHTFMKNEQGAILLPFIVILPFIIGLLFLSFEISKFIQKKAKLSDAIEQATLALTVENNDVPDAAQTAKNSHLVNDYARAYLPSESFSVPVIEIIKNSDHLEYKAKTTMSYSADFLAKTPITNKITTINTEDNGAARKNIIKKQNESTDVIFVTDYSGSMNQDFNNKGSGGEKIQALRDIFTLMNSSILKNSAINTIGFIPYSWGTKRVAMENQQPKEYCHFPFAPKIHKPNNDYFRQYTASELKKIPGLEGLDKIDNIKYAELDSDQYNDLYKKIESLLKGSDVDKALELLTDILNISASLTQIKIIGNIIDYDETIKSINSDAQYIDIPLSDVINKDVCLNHSNAYSLDNNIINNFIDSMIKMSATGGTLASSGILYANNLFRKESKDNNKKLMVIISDGVDSYSKAYQENPGFYITKKLIDKGMCEKIKENQIKMAFIAIAYNPEEIKEKERYIDWKKCVGDDNYYEAHNAHELEAELREVLDATSSGEVGRNTPKR